jgi:uncharacterized membrane protein
MTSMPSQDSAPYPEPSKAESTEETTRASASEQPVDFVWSFRGYKLRSGDFTTAMVHFFRAEVQRANVWRQRLDTTTYWAVVTTGAAISIAFSQASHHLVILLNFLFVTIFLLMEARRYRYYELWAYRVRLMETDFFAPMLVAPFHPSADWAEALSESLLHPQFPISVLEAIGRRLRRNYLYIYWIIGMAWLVKLLLIPNPVQSWAEFVQHASIGPIRGMWVLLVTLFFLITIVMISIGTIFLQDSAGEILPRFGLIGESPAAGKGSMEKVRGWFRLRRRRPQLLTLIITDQPEPVSQRIMKDMGRGVTALAGTGMFTGKTHSLLLCALTITEIPHIKALVAEADPKAFVVVIPAQEVLGMGFLPLEVNE